jgi:hypothetical protein
MIYGASYPSMRFQFHMEVSVSPAEQILKDFDKLPDSAVVPTSVAAKHDHVSERTVRRNYPLIRLTERRYGVTVGYLRHRVAKAGAA